MSMTECDATAESKAQPGHTHTCADVAGHKSNLHFCVVCRLWWWLW